MSATNRARNLYSDEAVLPRWIELYERLIGDAP